eukprot:2505978-Pyramimonas_sp.AAC.1
MLSGVASHIVCGVHGREVGGIPEALSAPSARSTGYEEVAAVIAVAVIAAVVASASAAAVEMPAA